MKYMLKSVLFLLLAVPAGATYTLTISTSGPVDPAAIVTSTPSGIVCPGTCAAVFAASSTVTIGEVAPSTMAFVGWGSPCRSNLPTCNVKMMTNTTVTAKFAPKLRVSFSGNGIGNVSISSQPVFTSSGSTASRDYVYPAGATIVLHESTGSQSAFVGWTGDGGCERASTCTITLNGYEHIIATFTATGSTRTLAVAIPLGGGTVVSSPAGISCPTVCSSTFTANASVTLTTTALSGYEFGGWANGGCSGRTTCVVVSSSPLQGLGGKFSPAAYFFQETQ